MLMSESVGVVLGIVVVFPLQETRKDLLTKLLLPSAMKLRRLCFYTCLSVHRGGGLPQCMLGYHPLGADNPPEPGTPRANTPFPLGTRHPPSRHPLPQQTATVVDGMHPTGMHSYSPIKISMF